MNFITVCTDAYPMLYAEIIHTRMAHISNIPFNHYCITDRAAEVGDWAVPISPTVKVDGWWNKLNLFSDETPATNILYMDLDIVILNNFDEEIYAMSESLSDISCVSDAINWMGVKFSSSLMYIKKKPAHIFNYFKNNYAEICGKPGGDQVWLGPLLKNVNYIDEEYPDLKKNLKFHLSHIDKNQIQIPNMISKNIKLVDCGGRPKPHELEMIPYIRDNWHKIRDSL